MSESKDSHRIYLDHNATTPLSKEVIEEIPKWLSSWGNPSSIYWEGRAPKKLLRTARKNISTALSCQPLEVVFTSGGSEANNLLLKSLFQTQWSLPKKERRDHFIVSSVEHPSLLKTMEFLKTQGAKVDLIPVNRDGEMNISYLEEKISEKTALVSVMYANNETGNIFPIRKLAQIARQKGAHFHCDAVQSLGKAVVDLEKWDVDSASFSAHKFYSLKGSGVLYVKRGTWVHPLIHGGAQERHRRAGTENVLSIAAFGEISTKLDEVANRSAKMKDLRNYLENQVRAKISNVFVTGEKGRRLCNTSSLILQGVDGETLLMSLDMKGISVSTGAACSSGSPEASPVLLAMGLSREEAQSSLRISLGWENNKEQIDQFLVVLQETVDRLRRL